MVYASTVAAPIRVTPDHAAMCSELRACTKHENAKPRYCADDPDEGNVGVFTAHGPHARLMCGEFAVSRCTRRRSVTRMLRTLNRKGNDLGRWPKGMVGRNEY